MSVEPTPLTKWKHGLIVAGLSAAGAFLGSLQTLITDPAGVAIFTAIGALVAEALTYEHSE